MVRRTILRAERKILTAQRAREILSYNAATGKFTWKISIRKALPVPGSNAGYIDKNGYKFIRADGILYCAHRLAWFYMTGEWPKRDIDHKNGIPGDDRWENLRQATESQNIANGRLRRNNTSGYKGVSKDTKTHGKWRAQIKKDGKFVALGSFFTPEEAHAAYVKAALQLFGEFANDGRQNAAPIDQVGACHANG